MMPDFTEHNLRPAHSLKCFLLMVAICISACSHNPFSSSAKMTQLIENQQYDKAIAQFAELTPQQQKQFDVADIKQQREALLMRALKQSRQATAKKKWLEGQQHLDLAIEKIPNSRRLQTESAVLNKRIEKLAAQDLIHIQWTLGNYYLQRKPINKNWINTSVKPLPYPHPDLTEPEQINQLSEAIGAYGLSQIAVNTDTANRYLTLAQALQDDQRWENALASMNKKQARQVKKAEQLQRENKQQVFAVLKSRFNSQMQDKNYLAAQQSLRKGEDIAVNSSDKTWLTTEQLNLNAIIDETVKNSLKLGQYSYSNGRIDEAISIWQKAQALAPNNQQLNDSIARANKFKQTYESLKE